MSQNQLSLIDLVIRGDLDGVQAALRSGADVNQTDHYKHTPIHFACSRGDDDILRVLLAARSRRNPRNVHGYTPLHIACIKLHTRCVRILIEAGAKVDAIAEFGMTPLHYASRYESGDLAKMLLDAGANVNAKDARGSTPLHCAIISGSAHTAKLLLARGADPDAATTDHKTPLACACANGLLPEIRLLLQSGVAPEGMFSTIRFRHAGVWTELMKVVIWRSYLFLPTLVSRYQRGLRVRISRPMRESMVEIRRLRDLLRPLVHPKQKDLRARRFGRSPLLTKLPWHLRVVVLRFIVARPVEKEWGVEEFAR